MTRLKRTLSGTNAQWPSTNGLSNIHLQDTQQRQQREKLSIAQQCSTIDCVPVKHQKCKVIATIGGERSSSVEALVAFLINGVTVCRYDFSHSTSSHEQFKRVMKNLAEAQKVTKMLCATYLSFGGDTCRVEVACDEASDAAASEAGSSSGSISQLSSTYDREQSTTKMKFLRGSEVRLTNTKEQKMINAHTIPLGDFFEHFAAHCSIEDEIFIAPLIGSTNDKSAKLIVRNVGSETVICECERDLEFDVGFAGNSISIRFRRESGTLSPGDERLLKVICRSVPVDFVSFGGSASPQQLSDLKRAAQKFYPKVSLIARIDSIKALKNLKDVCKVADAVLLARGDLGSVVAPEKMFRVQKFVLRVCEEQGTVSVVTRLVDSMIKAPRPTRAEATDVANIVLDGADALLLGKETYSGMFPVECVRTVLAVANAADKVYDYESRYARQKKFVSSRISALTDGLGEKYVSDSQGETKDKNAEWMKHLSNISRRELHKWSLAEAAVSCAYQTCASCIVVFSHTGETTRMISKYRPSCPVMSLTIPSIRGGSLSWVIEGAEEARQQLLIRGVIPVLSDGREAMMKIISGNGEHDSNNNDNSNMDVFLDALRQNPSGAADVEAMARLRNLGLIKPGGVVVFCQLIGGVSTVKIIEYGGRIVENINVGVITTPGSPGRKRTGSLHAANWRKDILHDDDVTQVVNEELFGTRGASPSPLPTSMLPSHSMRMAHIGTYSGDDLSGMVPPVTGHVEYPPPTNTMTTTPLYGASLYAHERSKLGGAGHTKVTSSIGNLTISNSRESLEDIRGSPSSRQMSPLGRRSSVDKEPSSEARTSFERESYARRRIELEKERDDLIKKEEEDEGTPFGKNINPTGGLPPASKFSPQYTGRM